MRRRRRKTALIKSNNPHLAGGEQILEFGCLRVQMATATLRTLAAMADALDEYLALIRIADAEGFDILNLQAGLDRPFGSI